MRKGINNMGLPTQEQFNTWYEQQFQSDLITRRKLKKIIQYNKLSIKTKIKRLKDNLKADIEFLQYKFIRDVKMVEQGGHPELGFEEHYETHIVDDCFNHTLKLRNKRLKKQGLKLNL